jgi:hypothetical protein
MKTFYAILASLLLALSSSAMAETGTTGGAVGERGTAGDQDFSELDREGEGFIDQQGAEDAGITQEEFEQMDRDGDGRVTEEEFRDYFDQRDHDVDNDNDDDGWFD